ncbi:spore coat protein GerQ, partial [Microbacteriaceae bacterium K1510]|nr:spore coat protein GerQ [Microbacteriaceae bacterium K1510]
MFNQSPCGGASANASFANYPAQPYEGGMPNYPYPYPFQPTQPVAPPQPSGTYIPVVPGRPFMEESYVENILRLNLGKVATIYMT